MTLPPETTSIERRPVRRRRVLLGGIVSYAGGEQSFDCTIRDITDTGARLLTRGRQFPVDFFLINVRDRLAYSAKVIWSKGPEVGVSFSNTFRLADITDPALSHLTNLWLARATR
jgi:hypothetical protein